MIKRRSGLSQVIVGSLGSATCALVLTIMMIEEPLSNRRARAVVESELTEALDAFEPPADAATIAERFGCRVERSATQPNERQPDRLYEVDGRFALSRAIGSDWVTVSRSTELVRSLREGTRQLLWVGSALAIALMLTLIWVFHRVVVSPARSISTVVDRLAEGDFSARTKSERLDELGEMGRGIDGVADVLTERIEQLRLGEDALRTVLNSMVEAVFVTDSLGRIEQTNDAFDRLAPESIGRTPMEVWRNEDLRAAVRASRRGIENTVELELMVFGVRRIFEAQVSPLDTGSDAQRPGVVTVLHDVTRLKEADSIRRDFVANASHELRTPLTAIRGYAETLRGGAHKRPETAERFLDIILKHTLRLQHLVNDLVALSRAESPEENTKRVDVDVGRCARDVVAGLEQSAIDHGLTISVVGEGHAKADERALDQVLVNLVSNAIKYTVDGEVKVEVGIAKKSDAQVLALSVFNTTPIPKEHLGRLFERFYRVDEGRSRDEGGTGLGLAIVKHQVLRMKGSIRVESDETSTTFHIELPTS